jgi:hypothetical protein
MYIKINSNQMSIQSLLTSYQINNKKIHPPMNKSKLLINVKQYTNFLKIRINNLLKQLISQLTHRSQNKKM